MKQACCIFGGALYAADLGGTSKGPRGLYKRKRVNFAGPPGRDWFRNLATTGTSSNLCGQTINLWPGNHPSVARGPPHPVRFDRASATAMHLVCVALHLAGKPRSVHKAVEEASEPFLDKRGHDLFISCFDANRAGLVRGRRSTGANGRHFGMCAQNQRSHHRRHSVLFL